MTATPYSVVSQREKSVMGVVVQQLLIVQVLPQGRYLATEGLRLDLADLIPEGVFLIKSRIAFNIRKPAEETIRGYVDLPIMIFIRIIFQNKAIVLVRI